MTHASNLPSRKAAFSVGGSSGVSVVAETAQDGGIRGVSARRRVFLGLGKGGGVKGLQRRRIPAPSIAAPRRVPLSKLHPASNGGIGLRAKPLIAVTILTASLIAAAGGPVMRGRRSP